MALVLTGIQPKLSLTNCSEGLSSPQVCLEEQQSWCAEISLLNSFQVAFCLYPCIPSNSKTWWDYSTVSNTLGAVEVPKAPWQPDRVVQGWALGTEDPTL